MAKQYKNVYTILEKARKGELVTQSTGSLFKPMNRYKKPDIITPHLHYLDEKSLFRNITQFLYNTNKITKFQIELASKGITKSSSEIQLATSDLLNKFPKSLINDFFKLYIKDISELSFEDRTAETKMRYQFIEKANQPLHKILTNGSNLKSLVYTEHVMEYFIKVMLYKKFANEPVDDLMNQMRQEEKNCSVEVPCSTPSSSNNSDEESDQDEDQEESTSGQGGNSPQNNQYDDEQENDEDDDSEDDMQEPELQDPNANSSQGQGGEGGNSGAGKNNDSNQHSGGQAPTMEQFINDILNNNEQELEEALIAAQKACVEIDEVYSENEQEDLWEQMQSFNSKGYDPDMIKNAAAKIRNMQMSMNGVKQFIKHIMDKSKNYFSAAETTKYESLVETGNMDGVEDYYMLHPKLRKVMFEDIITKDVVKQGKINLYIDVSGSMDSGCGVKGEDGRYITRLDFAKAFALKMKEMDLLNKIYVFDTSIYLRKTHMLDIININSGGGTSIETVVKHIIATDENAIVVTDADDRCQTYTSKAYFIGTEGARFSGFKNLDQYHRQMCVFDGHNVRKVNKGGYAV